MLQFGGASGSGYLSREEVYAGTEELKKYGTFEGGIFRRNDDVEGRRNTDGYQAIWEHVHGERMEYPKPRYRDPIMVDPVTLRMAAGCRHAGRDAQAARYVHRAPVRSRDRQLRARHDLSRRGASVYLVLSGSGIAQHDGYRPLTALHVEHGEHVDIVARDDTELVRLVLPDLTGIKERRAAHAVAAE